MSSNHTHDTSQIEGENRQNKEKHSASKYFYFDLADSSHAELRKLEEQEAKEHPMAPLEKVTEVEY